LKAPKIYKQYVTVQYYTSQNGFTVCTLKLFPYFQQNRLVRTCVCLVARLELQPSRCAMTTAVAAFIVGDFLAVRSTSSGCQAFG